MMRVFAEPAPRASHRGLIFHLRCAVEQLARLVAQCESHSRLGPATDKPTHSRQGVRGNCWAEPLTSHATPSVLSDLAAGVEFFMPLACQWLKTWRARHEASPLKLTATVFDGWSGRRACGLKNWAGCFGSKRPHRHRATRICQKNFSFVTLFQSELRNR